MSKFTDIHIRLPKDVSDQLTQLSMQRKLSKRQLAVAAIEQFLIKDAQTDSERVLQEVFEVKRRIIGLRGEVEILGELLSFYIYNWLGYTPRLESQERKVLSIEAKQRHSRFMTLFAKRIKSGESTLVAALGTTELEPEQGEESSEALG